MNNIHLRISKYRTYPSCLGVLAGGDAGFTAAAQYRGVTVPHRSFSKEAVMPLGQVFYKKRDRKISFGIIYSFIDCHRETVCAVAISRLKADCHVFREIAASGLALLAMTSQKLSTT